MSRERIPDDELHALMGDIRELRGAALSSTDIANRLSLDAAFLSELESRYRGMTNDQIQHLLYVERENERLRDIIERLRDQMANLEDMDNRRFD